MPEPVPEPVPESVPEFELLGGASESPSLETPEADADADAVVKLLPTPEPKASPVFGGSPQAKPPRARVSGRPKSSKERRDGERWVRRVMWL